MAVGNNVLHSTKHPAIHPELPKIHQLHCCLLVFHTRINSIKGTITLLSRQQWQCSKLMRKSSLHRIQGFGTDCLVSGGVWTLLRITSAPNFCNISFAWSLNTSQGKRTSLTNYLRETWIQPKSVGVLPLSLVRPTLNLKDCRYLKTLLDLFFLHLMRNFLLGKILEQKHLPVLDPLWYQFPFSFKARQKKKALFSPSGQPLSHLSEKPLRRSLKNVFFFFFPPQVVLIMA